MRKNGHQKRIDSDSNSNFLKYWLMIFNFHTENSFSVAIATYSTTSFVEIRVRGRWWFDKVRIIDLPGQISRSEKW